LTSSLWTFDWGTTMWCSLMSTHSMVVLNAFSFLDFTDEIFKTDVSLQPHPFLRKGWATDSQKMRSLILLTPLRALETHTLLSTLSSSIVQHFYLAASPVSSLIGQISTGYLNLPNNHFDPSWLTVSSSK
jgi:hypothetical protein